MKHLSSILLATIVLSLAAFEALAAEPAGNLAGQVLDADGKPAAGATIWLIGGPYTEQNPKILETATADDQGRFVFSDMKTKHPATQSGMRWPVLFARSGQDQIGWESKTWDRRRKAPSQAAHIKLAAVQEYRARLVDASGRPIAKARIKPLYWYFGAPGYSDSFGVQLHGKLSEQYASETDGEGEFTYKQMPTGLRISAEIAAPEFGVFQAVWSLEKPIMLRLEKPGKIRGTTAVPSGAGSLAGMEFYVQSKTELALEKVSDFYIAPRKYKEVTNKDGVFLCDDIPPGKYVITPELYESSLPFTAKTTDEFEVKSDEVVNISIPLRPAIEVHVQVVDAETGKGVSGVILDADMVDDGRVRHSMRRGTTDAEGKFVAFVDPGTFMVVVEELPDVYLNPSLQSDLPMLDIAQAAVYPTIKLEHGVKLEGLVVDESGKPIADAEVQALLPPNSRERVSETADQNGRFSIKGLAAKSLLAIRARSSAGVSEIMEIRPADIQPPLRIELSPKRAFTLWGTCVDAAGLPISRAKINLSTVWMLGSTGIGFEVWRGVTDDKGLFHADNLWPGSTYRVSAEAEGFSKYESKQFKGEPGANQDLGKLALIGQKGSVEGILVDSAGKPVAGVRVFNSGDAPKTLSTTSDTSGRFRLEGLRSGGVYVFAEKDGYRLKAVATNSNATGLTIRLLRTDEPAPPWKPARPPAAYAEELEAAGKLLEKLHSLPQQSSYPWTYRFMARIDPARAIEWTKNAKGRYKSEPCQLAAEKIAETDVEEAIALLVPMADYRSFITLESLANHYVASDPAKAERLAEEAILLARKFDQPEQDYALAQAGELVVRLGKTDQGRKLIEEAAAMAEKMGTADRNVYYRGLVAAPLALFDLPRALSIVEPTDAGYEKARALARIAKTIAPQNLEKALEMLKKLDRDSSLPDDTRVAIAYQLAPTRLKDAITVLDSMDTFAAAKAKAEAYGWLAAAVAPKDPETAWSFVDKSISLYEKNAQEMRSWSSSGGRGGFAAHVAVHASAIAYSDMGSLIDRVLAMRPSGDEGRSQRELQKPTVIMAKLIAMTDPETAKHLLETVAPRIDEYTEFDYSGVEARDWYQAWALADLAQTVDFWQKRMEEARSNPDFKLDQTGLDITIELLTTPAAERPQLMLRYLGGYWFPGED
jgi:Carboxypeptidase regulatory-like domain